MVVESIVNKEKEVIMTEGRSLNCDVGRSDVNEISPVIWFPLIEISPG